MSANQKPDRVPVYSSRQILENLHAKWNSVKQPYPAMYSSYFGGIILDPAMMVLPIDDHMVHRGHGVFDTAVILNGKGTLRYWLSAGPGDFLLSPAGSPAFYAVVIDDNFSQCRKGVKVVTAATPMKPPLFATMKNVNYLPNVFATMEAAEKGAFSSVWVDEDGHVAEGPNVNVAFVSKNDELLLPTFDSILAGCTAKRLLALAPKLVERGLLKRIEVRKISLEEAKNSAEMMCVGSTLPLLPIIEWDGRPVGNGKVGKLTLALSDLLWEDMVSGPERIRVPYEEGEFRRSNM
ncbi:hypothetical protein HPP92_028635 [Vanilla planifolia]|uniref:Uncharacterized protein n=1 Tax=Vanilla planifolia TaxID=51239 RepID=A0A835P8I4_VANPL|nr:hypothetical protein HPP92_028635 [Vanilla planifolia]